MDTEQPLLSFGPFGVSVCDGPYGVFKWQWQNVFLIEFTDHCLRGSRRFRFPFFRHSRGGASFEISYPTIISVRLSPHPARLGLMQVLDITYRDARGAREVDRCLQPTRRERVCHPSRPRASDKLTRRSTGAFRERCTGPAAIHHLDLARHTSSHALPTMQETRALTAGLVSKAMKSSTSGELSVIHESPTLVAEAAQPLREYGQGHSSRRS